jgi:signal transduction histidine kinase
MSPRRLVLGGAVLLLAGLTAAVGLVTHEINDRAAAALAEQRVHVERLSQIERLARATHSDMVERWLLPWADRPRREQALEERVSAVRQAARDFAALPVVDPAEAPLTAQLMVQVALWSNRVDQASVSADGPSATPELRAHLDGMAHRIGELIDVVSRAGSSTDRRLSVLRLQQTILQVAFVVTTLMILALALFWARARRVAEERAVAAEAARDLEQREARQRATFFAGLSHELRTPLVAIQGFASNLAERSAAEAARAAAARIAHESQELLSIINNILEAAKLDAGKVEVHLEPVDVAEVLHHCVQRCQGLVVGRPVELRCEIDGKLPAARADLVKLGHVFTNLVANAVKFTPSGSVTVRAHATGGAILIEVADTGVGIPPEALDRIWKPFVQVSTGPARQHNGTGLGLSISRGLLELMGGRIDVRSTEGEGSVFTVMLPTEARPEQLAS